MKVAWISDFPLEWLPDLPPELQHLPRGHPATWQLVLLGEFAKRPDLELHIFALRKNVARDVSFTWERARFHVLKVPRGVRAASLFWVDTWLIRRRLREIGPDLVHAWGTERGAGLIASRLEYPFLVTIQGLLTWYQTLIPLTFYERFATALEWVSLKRARLVTTESTFAVQFLQERFPRLAVTQVEHAPNWQFHSGARNPRLAPMRFLSVGTPGYRKGTDLLLQGLNSLVDEFDFELIIVGTTNEAYVEAHKALLSDKLRRRVTFQKNLTPAEVSAEMAKATMMILPTRADTSPNAVKEAVVAGVPVAASAIGGVLDYVFDGRNGVLFPPGDLGLFARAMRVACQHTQFRRGDVEAETLARMREYLSPREMDRRFFAAYSKVITLFNRP